MKVNNFPFYYLLHIYYFTTRHSATMFRSCLCTTCCKSPVSGGHRKIKQKWLQHASRWPGGVAHGTEGGRPDTGTVEWNWSFKNSLRKRYCNSIHHPLWVGSSEPHRRPACPPETQRKGPRWPLQDGCLRTAAQVKRKQKWIKTCIYNIHANWVGMQIFSSSKEN